jgi:hypothetical protein
MTDRGELGRVLVEMEHEGWRALSNGTGADFYDRNLTENAVMIFPMGVLDRAQSIEAMRAAPPWSSFRIDEPQVMSLTAESAILTYRATAQRDGQPEYNALMTTAFVKEDGTWKTALHQHTPIVS